MRVSSLIAILFTLLYGGASAQPVVSPYFFYLNDLSIEQNEKSGLPAGSLRPFINGFNINNDSISTLEEKYFGQLDYKSRFLRKLKTEHLLQVDSSDFKISFDPLFLFEYGPDIVNGDTLFRNTRGVRVSASIGRSFYLETSFLENQSRYPLYVREFTDSLKVFPQQGRAKPFKVNGSDFAMAWGSLGWRPTAWMMIRAGHDKFFVGNGYRSLLLSDNAFVMPFAQLTIINKSFTYTSVWSNLQTLRYGAYIFNPLSEPVFERKGYSFQYLTWKPAKFLEAGFFYSTIWRDFPVWMAAPLPASAFGSSDKVNRLAGLNLSANILKNITVYGQAAYNGKNRGGFQTGIRSRHTAGIKNLNLLLEYNRVNPHTYQTPSIFQNDLQGFHHYNQSLTHSLGANFQEWVATANYRIKDFFFWAKINYFEQWRAGNSLLPLTAPTGNQILNAPPPPPEAEFGQGTAYFRSIREINFGYLLNRKTNLCIAAGLKMAGGSNQSSWINLSIGTRLWNQYIDF